MELDPFAIRPEVLDLVPEVMCRKYRLLPIDRIERSLMLAMADTNDSFAMDDIKFLTGLDVVPVAASEAAIAEALDSAPWPAQPNVTEPMEGITAFALSESPEGQQEDTPEHSDDVTFDLSRVETSGEGDSPVLRAVNKILIDAIRENATVVHLNPVEAGVRVSFRVDDTMREVIVLPKKLTQALVSRMKVLSHLDIAEKRLPQDGRLRIRVDRNGDIDMMVCTLPTSRGELITIRIDERRKPPRSLDELGLATDDLHELTQATQIASGLVLVAGPARSGRTTTLYALLKSLDTRSRSILTAEDPIAHAMDGIAQTQVREAIGFTYAAAIRSFCRHEPDLIVVDTTRDAETASALLAAAAAGIAAMATITADGAPEALLELARLEGGSSRVAATVRFVIAQRLVRRCCDGCKGTGCDACGQTGYRGRFPIVELFRCSEAVRSALMSDADRATLRRLATGEGMKTFAAQALKAAESGLTTRDEYRRIAAETEAG